MGIKKAKSGLILSSFLLFLGKTKESIFNIYLKSFSLYHVSQKSKNVMPVISVRNSVCCLILLYFEFNLIQSDLL